VAGILIASALVTLLTSFDLVSTSWRFLFWAGSLTALVGLFIRSRAPESTEFVSTLHFKREIFQYKRPFLAILIAAGFSYMTYSYAFILLNAYVPLITSIPSSEMMKVNTILLWIDFLLLPLFGYLSLKLGKEKLMMLGALLLALLAFPLFSLLTPNATLFTASLIRILIVICGTAFAAPYHAWALEQVPAHCRSTLLCLGYSIGSQLIGAPTAAISLWLYHKTHWAAAPALYLIPICLLALTVLRRAPQKSEYAQKAP
jgi:MFS family permease